MHRCFNRRGDSLGGAASRPLPGDEVRPGFNRRGDSLGGAAWKRSSATWRSPCFNRRGDSLGGAASDKEYSDAYQEFVSIAGAILWGVLRKPALKSVLDNWAVSIAGAILWGVLLEDKSSGTSALQFQSQGRFFGGCCVISGPYLARHCPRFNRRGDSLGGAARLHRAHHSQPTQVSIAGAILWGVLPRCLNLNN